MSARLACRDLVVAVDTCRLVDGLNLSLQPGQVTVVLGRNGTGKSLTLRTLAGLRPPSGGQIVLQQTALEQWPRRAVAQQLAYVAQDSDEPFPVTVLESAVTGRHPHLDFWQWESPADYALAGAALAEVDLAPFADRAVETLSGGERRRLAIATALTQAPQIFVLDEPTNHLDPQHQLQVLKLMRARADAGMTVLMSLHDPNLALRFADQVLLLFGDGRWATGTAPELLQSAALSELYRVPIDTLHAAGHALFVVR